MKIPTCSGIYRIVDLPSGRFYVGSATSIAQRWKQHCYRLARGIHPNPILQAIWKVDSKRLIVAVLLEMPSASRSELLLAEQRELDASGVGSNPQCMNVLAVAGSPIGRKRSEETKRRMAEAQRGKRASDATRAKQRAAKLGRKLAPDHVAKCVPKLREGNRLRWERDRGKPFWKKRSLSADQVRQFVELRAQGWKLHDLRRRFGIGFGTAQRLAAGETYKELLCA